MQHFQQNSFSKWATMVGVFLFTIPLLTAAAPRPLYAAIELPTQPYLPLALALEAANAAVAQCEADGYHVSVAVVDRSGELKVLLKGDGAGPHTVGSSTGKAFTAASLGRATTELANMIAENPAIAGLRDMDDRIVILAGGLPIVVNEVVVGGIGVGGAPGGSFDEACAQAGIDQMMAEETTTTATPAVAAAPAAGVMAEPAALCAFAGTDATIVVNGKRAYFTCESRAGQEDVVLLGEITADENGWMIEQAVLQRSNNDFVASATSEVVVTHIELEDGTRCAWAGSGATIAIAEKRANFTCETPTLVLLGDIVLGDAGWEIEKVILTQSDSGFDAGTTETALVAALGVAQQVP